MHLLTLLACSGPTLECGPGTHPSGDRCLPDLANPPDPDPTDTSPTDTAPPDDCEEDPELSVWSVDVATPEDKPLVRRFEVALTRPASLALACRHDGDPTEVHYQVSEPAPYHEVVVAGLLPDTGYTCRFAPLCPRATVAPTELSIHTEPLDDRFPPVTATHESSLGLEGGPYLLTNVQQYCAGDYSQRLVVYDAEGRERWYHEAPDGMDMGIEARVHDGEVVWGGGNTPDARAERVTLEGEVVYKVDFEGAGGLQFHHDGKQLPDGRLMTLTYEFIPVSGSWRYAFAIRTHALGSTSPDWVWSSEDGLAAGDLPGGVGDLYHANWMDIVDSDEGPTAYVSMCALSQVLAVDVATGAVKWKMGLAGDFDLVDAAGNPLGEHEFTGCQHGLEVDGDRVLVYDNGWYRGYSRVAQYTVDTSIMTATLDWTWEGESWYETALGDADWLPNDHLLVTKAHAECFGSSPGARSEVVEVDQPSGEVVWRLRFDDIDTATCRAERVDGCALFRDVRYCDTAATGFEAARAILGW